MSNITVNIIMGCIIVGFVIEAIVILTNAYKNRK